MVTEMKNVVQFCPSPTLHHWNEFWGHWCCGPGTHHQHIEDRYHDITMSPVLSFSLLNNHWARKDNQLHGTNKSPLFALYSKHSIHFNRGKYISNSILFNPSSKQLLKWNAKNSTNIKFDGRYLDLQLILVPWNLEAMLRSIKYKWIWDKESKYLTRNYMSSRFK